MASNELMSPEQIRDEIRRRTDDLWNAMRDGNEEEIVMHANALRELTALDQTAVLERLRQDPEHMDEVILQLYAVRAMRRREIAELFNLPLKTIGEAIDRAIELQEAMVGTDLRERMILSAMDGYREVMRVMFPRMAAGSMQATKHYLAAQDNMCRLLGLNAPDRKLIGLGIVDERAQLILPEKDVVDGDFKEVDE